jgi:hypothetical protein
MVGHVQVSAGVVFLTVAFTVGAAVWPHAAQRGRADLPPDEPRIQPSSLIQSWPIAPSVTHQPISEEPLIDLYGNEILTAIGRYTLDLNGTLYEEHAPNVALPALQDPEI